MPGPFSSDFSSDFGDGQPGPVTSNIHYNAPGWTNHTFALGEACSNAGNAYRCITAGTSTVAPTGTSADSAPGGAAHFRYLSAIDYTTVQAWYSGITTPLAYHVVGQLWNNGEIVFGIDTPVMEATVGSVVPGAFTITLTTAPGEGIKDRSTAPLAYNATNGVAFHGTGSTALGTFASFYIAIPNFILDGIQYKSDIAAGVSALAIDAGGSSGFPITVQKCVFDVFGQTNLTFDFGGGYNWKINNCLVVDRQTGSNLLWFIAGTANPGKFSCCTFLGVGPPGATAIAVQANAGSAGQVIIKDCAAFGYTAPFRSDIFTGAISVDHSCTNVASFTTCTDGGGNLFSRTTANQFVSPTSDFRLKAGADCIGAGVADSDIAAGDDFFGTARGTPWDIGTAEYIAPASGVAAVDGPGVTAIGANVTTLALPAKTSTGPAIWVLFVRRDGQPVSSVDDTAGLTWALRGTPPGALQDKIEEWWAAATSAKAANVVTIHFASAPTSIVGSLCCITGVDVVTPFDTNGTIQAAGTSDPLNVSTSAQNSIILGALRTSTASPTAGSGWTPIHDATTLSPFSSDFSADFGGTTAGTSLVVEYRIVSSPQTNLPISLTIGAGFANGVIGDALTATPSTVFFGASQISASAAVQASARVTPQYGSAKLAVAASVRAAADVIQGAPAPKGPFSFEFSADFGAGATGVLWDGSAQIDGVATLRSAASHTPQGSARISGSATVIATGALRLSGIARISGAATVIAPLVSRLVASARISGSAAIFADAIRIQAGQPTIWPGAAQIAGSVSVLAAAIHRTFGASRIGGAGQVFADASVQRAGGGTIQFGSARISGQANVTATMRARFRAIARISGAASIFAIGHPINPLPPSVGSLSGAPFYVVNITARRPGAGSFAWAMGWNTTAWNTAGLTPASTEATSVISASDIGYRSSVNDTGGVASFPPLVNEAFAIDRAMFLEPGANAVAWQWGNIRLANDDGRFDNISATWNVDGRPVEILRGAKHWDDSRGIWTDPRYSELVPVFGGVATPWHLDVKELRIPLRDATYWIERPVNADQYGGTGFFQGTPQLAGTPKPMARGGTALYPIRNVTPVLIDPVNLIYQYNNAAGTVVSLYEGLAETITFSADTSNLYSGTTPPGQYRTDNSRGAFQLGSIPVHAITADVTGEFPSEPGPITIAAEIVQKMFTRDMQLPLANINLASFAAAKANYPYIAGIYFAPNDNPDGATAASRVLSSFGAKLIITRTGELSCLVLRAIPVDAPAVAALDMTNLVSLTPLPLPNTVDPPPYRLRLAWQHNYTIQTSDLNATADQTVVQFAAAPDTYEAWSSLDIINQYRRPNDPPPFGGALLVKDDATQVVGELGILWGAPRALYEAVVPVSVGLGLDIGDIVSITYPMGTLRVGQLGQIVGERFRSVDATVVLQILAAVSVVTTVPRPFVTTLSGTASIRATALMRAAGRATIAGVASLQASAVAVPAGASNVLATIPGAVTVAATARMRYVGAARIGGAVAIQVAAFISGGVVPPGQPTVVAIDVNPDLPGVPGGVTIT